MRFVRLDIVYASTSRAMADQMKGPVMAIQVTIDLATTYQEITDAVYRIATAGYNTRSQP